MSQITADRQFQTNNRAPSNLDRCNRCGAPRSAHGLDWACSPGAAPGHKHFARLVVAGGLVVIGGVAALTATSPTGTTLSSLAAAFSLGCLTLLVCVLAIVGRRL